MQLNLRLNILTLRYLTYLSNGDYDSLSLKKFKTGRHYRSVLDSSDEEQLQDQRWIG